MNGKPSLIQQELDEWEAGFSPCPNAGDVLTDEMIDKGCMDDAGGVFIGGAWECTDGRRLWSDDNLWAWVGEPVTETDGDSAADSAYSAAYTECRFQEP